MANPIKVVKAIGRAVGGITGKGSKNVNPVYKEIGRTNQIIQLRQTILNTISN